MIYFVRPVEGGPIKIGHTGNMKARHADLQASYGRRLAILRTIPGGFDEEQALHARFARYRIGQSEQFQPGDDLMDFIGVDRVPGWHLVKDMSFNPDGSRRRHAGSGPPVSFRISPRANQALLSLCEEFGLTKTQAIEVALDHLCGTTQESDAETAMAMIGDEIRGIPG